MQKKLVIIIISFSILVLVKYFFSNYEINYNVDNYNVNTKLENNRVYFEITKENKYNFDIYTKSKRKLFINKIKEIVLDNYMCILPYIEDVETYPLCYDKKNNYNIDFNLINDSNLDEYKTKDQIISKPEKKDFIYYNNLNNNEYIALWTYKGYIIMNKDGYKNINLFNNDRYDNDLSYQIDEYIYMPNYDEKFEFSELIKFNIITGESSSINIDNKIDYDSYVVGNVKNKIYIFDNKSAILYSINIKNKKIEIISSNEKGYYKYENGKFIECNKNEYKNKKIKFSENEYKSNYIYDDGFKIIKEDNDIKTKINNNQMIKIFENKNDLYYIQDNSFYKYNPLRGSIKIFYDYELSFNNSKSVFMYYK